MTGLYAQRRLPGWHLVDKKLREASRSFRKLQEMSWAFSCRLWGSRPGVSLACCSLVFVSQVSGRRRCLL